MVLLVITAAVSSDFLDSLGFGGFGDCVDNEGDIISSLTEAITGMTSDEVTAEYYNQYYDFLQGDWWGLATGSGGIYDTSTNNFNDSYLEAMGMQYAMYNTVRPFDWDSFVLYAKARRAAELVESGSFDSDSYFTKNPQDPINISSSGLKNVANYWGDYYKPMPTTTQYMFSFQSEESTDTTKPYSIGLDFPIYMNTNGSWGKKNWSGVYVLPFVKDDDLSGTCFPTRYFHFYSTKDDDNVVTIVCDYYSLETNELVENKSLTWDITTYPYVAAYLSTSTKVSATGYNNLKVEFYPSYSNYLSGNSYKTYSSFSSFDIRTFYTTDYSQSGLGFYDLVNAVTFTPEINKNDDYGVYLSSEPFQLFMNQTSIDFDKIPDNYTITINGDTIYDYSITNPDTGDTSTINEYVTNNYTYITNNNGGDSGSSSGTSSGDVNVGGNVTVSGDVNVGGEITIKTDPIDINVNVNGGGSSGSGSSEASGVQFDQDVSLNNYYDWMNEQTSGFGGFMSQFFSWLPADIVVLLCAGFACVILARFLGR